MLLYMLFISKSQAINLLKNSVLENRIYKKYIFCLNFQSTQGSFFLLFCFNIFKIVDSECSTNTYKPIKISIGKVTRNP